MAGGLFYGQGSVLWLGFHFMARGPFYGRGSGGGLGCLSQHINLGVVSFTIKADLRPFLASLGIVHGRTTRDGHTDGRMTDGGWTFGVIDPMRLRQSANNQMLQLSRDQHAQKQVGFSDIYLQLSDIIFLEKCRTLTVYPYLGPKERCFTNMSEEVGAFNMEVTVNCLRAILVISR